MVHIYNPAPLWWDGKKRQENHPEAHRPNILQHAVAETREALSQQDEGESCPLTSMCMPHHAYTCQSSCTCIHYKIGHSVKRNRKPKWVSKNVSRPPKHYSEKKKPSPISFPCWIPTNTVIITHRVFQKKHKRRKHLATHFMRQVLSNTKPGIYHQKTADWHLLWI